MSCRAGTLALAAVRIVRAAAHHQVNYQHRDAQDAGQADHTIPHLPVIGGKVRHLQAIWPARCPGGIIQAAVRKQDVPNRRQLAIGKSQRVSPVAATTPHCG